MIDLANCSEILTQDKILKKNQIYQKQKASRITQVIIIFYKNMY